MFNYVNYQDVFHNFLKSSNFSKNIEILTTYQNKALEQFKNPYSLIEKNKENLNKINKQYNELFIDTQKKITENMNQYKLSDYNELMKQFNDYNKSIAKINLSIINETIQSIQKIA